MVLSDILNRTEILVTNDDFKPINLLYGKTNLKSKEISLKPLSFVVFIDGILYLDQVYKQAGVEIDCPKEK